MSPICCASAGGGGEQSQTPVFLEHGCQRPACLDHWRSTVYTLCHCSACNSTFVRMTNVFVCECVCVFLNAEHTAKASITSVKGCGRLWLRGRASVLLSEGCWFDSTGLHVKVSLGRILNLKLLLMCWSAPCKVLKQWFDNVWNTLRSISLSYLPTYGPDSGKS